MTYEQLRQQVLEAGIVGAGGAGFPTHIKLATQMDYLVVNGAECEPLLYTDAQLLEHYGMEVIEGVHEILQACQIKQGVIALKNKYEELATVLEEKAQKYPEITICRVSNVYPIGDEVSLIYEATGRVIPRGALPSSKKVVVANVETILNVIQKVKSDLNVTDTYVTIAGMISKPQVVKVPIGTKLSDLLALLNIEVTKEMSFLIGGPMMGDFGSIDAIITKTTKAILILPQDHILHKHKAKANFNVVKRIMACCSQCRMCTDLCPRNKLGHKVEPHKVMNAFANGLMSHPQGLETALGCCGCNACSYFACHHNLSPSILMGMVKKELLAQGIKGTQDNDPTPKGALAPRIPSSRLLERIGLKQFDKKAYLNTDSIKPEIVTIPLRQHIGAPAQCVVVKGKYVVKGEVIGKALEGVSTNIHASIDGEVVEVTTESIVIRRCQVVEGR